MESQEDLFTTIQPAINADLARPVPDAEQAYRRPFPTGPQPLLVFRRDNPQDMERLRQLFETLEKAAL